MRGLVFFTRFNASSNVMSCLCCACMVAGKSSKSNTAATLPFIFFLCWNNRYNAGNTNRVRNVAVMSPPITTVASGRCTSAPAPLLSAIGRKPKEATAAVINTGRKRLRVPVITNCRGSVMMPSFLIRLNSESNTIPFNTATPNRAINPTPADMLKGMPLRASAKTPPMADNGMAV
ncbi:hypothetical protein D3C80_1044520 [compost metagenome]